MSANIIAVVVLTLAVIAIAQILMPFFVMNISSKIGRGLERQREILAQMEHISLMLREIKESKGGIGQPFESNRVSAREEILPSVTSSDAPANATELGRKISMYEWNDDTGVVSRGTLRGFPFATLDNDRIRIRKENEFYEFNSMSEAEEFVG